MAKIDLRISMVVGFSLIGFSGLLLAVVEHNSRVDWMIWAGLIQGLGSGILWVPVTRATFWTLPDRLLPDGSAMFHLLRNVGQSIYIALCFVVIVRTGQTSYSELIQHINPYNEGLNFDWVSGLWSTESRESLASLSNELVRQSQLIAFNNAFLLYSWTCFAIIPVVFLWSHKRQKAR